MSTSISAFDEKILTRIFVRLPMPDLMSTELVCKHWKVAHHLTCESKRKLTLYVDTYREHEDVARYWYHAKLNFGTQGFAGSALRVISKNSSCSRDFTIEHSKALVAKFPNITRLSIYGLSSQDFPTFALMLQRWSNLELLSIILGENFPFEIAAQASSCPKGGELDFVDGLWKLFWSSLAKLRKLRHLALDFHFHLVDMFVREVLPRLESLYLGIGYDECGEAVERIFIGLPPTLKRLTLTRMNKVNDGDSDSEVVGDEEEYEDEGIVDELEDTYHDLNQLLRHVNKRSFNQLEHFGWHGDRELDLGGVDLKLMNFIASKFLSLKSLDLNLFPHFSLHHLLEFLSEMPNSLSSIRLSQQHLLPREAQGGILPLSEDEVEDEYEAEFDPLISCPKQLSQLYDLKQGFGLFHDLTSECYKRKLNPATSILTLHLAKIDIFSWDLFDYLQFAFPNVTELHLEQVELTMKKKLTPHRGVSRCAVLLDTLRQWPSIERVYRNGKLVLDFAGQQQNDANDEELEIKAKELLRKTKWINLSDDD